MVAAARNLGASWPRVFFSVELPYALPGTVVALLFSIVLVLGDFVAASVLGGNNVYYLSAAIQDRIKISDWPLAAAIATLMLLIVLGLLSVVFTTIGRLPAVKGMRGTEMTR